jgi:hypothetical protein
LCPSVILKRNRLFFGKIKQRLTGTAETRSTRTSVHDKTDLFSHLPVNVAEDGMDIYDGLSGYFDDVVEFQGRKARMEMSLVDVPPLLQIQLQVNWASLSREYPLILSYSVSSSIGIPCSRSSRRPT